MSVPVSSEPEVPPPQELVEMLMRGTQLSDHLTGRAERHGSGELSLLGHRPDVPPGEPPWLQFSSGSSSHPIGVRRPNVLSHGRRLGVSDVVRYQARLTTV